MSTVPPEKCIEREKYYIDLLGSEYNIVKDTTLPLMSGRTHSDATKIIMSDAKKPVGWENHTNYGKTLSFGAMKLKKSCHLPKGGMLIKEKLCPSERGN